MTWERKLSTESLVLIFKKKYKTTKIEKKLFYLLQVYHFLIAFYLFGSIILDQYF